QSELPALWAAQEKITNWFRHWAAAQRQASLDEDVPFTFVNGTHASMRRSEMFLHLLTHSSYHRGWVAEMFLEAGARPPQPHLSVFLFGAPRGLPPPLPQPPPLPSPPPPRLLPP